MRNAQDIWIGKPPGKILLGDLRLDQG